MPRDAVEAHQHGAEHHTRCPICGHQVDERDLKEVLAHLDPNTWRPSGT